MKLFYIGERKITYDELIITLNTKKNYTKVVKKKYTFEYFIEILFSLLHNIEITLVDSTNTNYENKYLGLVENDFEEVSIQDEYVGKIENWEMLVKKVEENSKNWTVNLFTSGTTGRPKQVKHTYTTLTRFLKKDKKYNSDIWGFAYNPSHIAGLQVFFQAFMNKNCIVNLFDLTSNDVIIKMCQNYVSHLSATPTFIRKIIPLIQDPLEYLKILTFGGEKFDESMKTKLEAHFPNAKIRTIYALTEAGSVLSSKGELYSIPDKLKDKVKINKAMELILHKSLLGDFDKEKLKGEWYYTNDLVKMIDENQFIIVNRKGSMINIGGYKVNPAEIEEAIRSIENVIDVIVFGKKNRLLGNVLIAHVVPKKNVQKEDLEIEIISFLTENFQKWKLPRMIKFINNIPQSRTGKAEKLL